ncbi:unnamed protein product [Protopolystoma xenopodis]|uniref:SSD domain-containing protein n=1 Tax=Protopolystoma xenopodis TaxID=117903 RepID=A0A3S5CH23_9PLAT|nr:unnamed protein product [Protopolystoma xenopodis]
MLFSLLCLLDWRDPIRSQCWLAIAGLLVVCLALLAGLGISALCRIPFNGLTLQASQLNHFRLFNSVLP